MSVAEESLEVWFRREVLSHDEPLTRFLSRRWRDREELADLRQETYARVFEAAQKEKPRMPRAFLFTTARHLVTDQIRRNKVASFLANGINEHPDLVDEISPEKEALARADLEQVNRALQRLSAKCREVFWLRRVQDLPQREVAERLGVSEKMVEKHLHTGMLKLRSGCRGAVKKERNKQPYSSS